MVRYFAQTARQNKQQWKITRNLKGYVSPVLENFNRENDTSFPTREMLQIDLNQVFIMTQSNNQHPQTLIIHKEARDQVCGMNKFTNRDITINM